MATDVQNAIGTQRQFRKLPPSTYQANLKNPSFGSHISKGANYKAEQLASSLGVLGKALWQEKVAEEERKMNQFTLEEGLRMVAGKTNEDLAAFDRMIALQHADTGYNLTDNKYAMAVLERAMGVQAASNAKQEWLKNNEGVVPKSVEDAVGSYTEHVQDSLDKFKDSISNKEAFNSGFEDSFFQDVLVVANNARQAIDKDKREAGIRCASTTFQNLVANYKNIPEEDFKNQIKELSNMLQVCTKTTGEAAKVWTEFLQMNVSYINDPALLDSLKDTNIFTDGDGNTHILNEEIPLGTFYELASNKKLQDTASGIIDQVERPDGSYDIVKAMELVEEDIKAHTESPDKTSAYLYNPNYNDELRKQVERDYNDRTRILNLKWKQNEEDLIVAINGTESYKTKQDLVDKSDLPEHIKSTYRTRLKNEEDRKNAHAARIRRGGLSPHENYWEKYGANQYTKDMVKLDYLKHRKDTEGLTEEEERTMYKLQFTIDAYLSYANPRRGVTHVSRYGNVNGVYMGNKSIFGDPVSNIRDAAIAQGYSEEEIDEYLRENGYLEE